MEVPILLCLITLYLPFGGCQGQYYVSLLDFLLISLIWLQSAEMFSAKICCYSLILIVQLEAGAARK